MLQIFLKKININLVPHPSKRSFAMFINEAHPFIKEANINCSCCFRLLYKNLLLLITYLLMISFLESCKLVIFNKNKQCANLFFLLEEGNLEAANEYLSKGCNINLKDAEGKTPLMQATLAHKSKIVEYLINKDAQLNIQDNNGNTAVHYAIDDISILKNLINAHADLNIKENNLGLTPLHLASAKGEMHAIEELIKSGAHIDSEDNEKCTPLCTAAGLGQKDAVELLIKLGANVNSLDINNNTILEQNLLSIRSLKIELKFRPSKEKEYLLYKEMQNILKNAGAQARKEAELIFASIEGNEQEVEKAIMSSLDINSKICFDAPAIYEAALFDNKSIVKMLIKHGADVNAKNKYNEETALFAAIANENIDMIKLLISSGALISETNFSGLTVLDIAKWSGREDIIAIIEKEKK
ncbi:MAG: hypothetical protein A2Y62_00730 [Candidatus Fischerbacteria bacterium RBG_13_37_8]|uniref:Uncharacterized protein n=1 Tax=Candidatus Fischerbacteria bacterium RBG_13_37_8 TaxID=1817863 RepID=A0A1F5VX33_9BACT|nr:MAG: hypothetical protein A2Y62_00730 [Candidatus Fischerbacteria bacterium RBG_13_37_8]